MQSAEPTFRHSPWPHRFAVVLACATFPLVWVGGLVTTTDSGMAVPDWPNTYGYNLFLYPWKTWLLGPWDLFIEHGHRLLGATVGLLTIGLLMVLYHSETRRWVKLLGFIALGLVVFQGILGGMRVRLDERTLALLHGCTGPLFFALAIALVVVTSRPWTAGTVEAGLRSSANVRGLAAVTAVLAYLQIVFGAVLRHVPVDAQPATFLHAVKAHLGLAAVLAVHIAALTCLIQTRARHVKPLGRLSAVLMGLLLLQIVLGAGTWIVKFAVPAWATDWVLPQQAAVADGGWVQTHVITAHVAVGSLILVTAVALALFAQRLLAGSRFPQEVAGRTKLGAAV